METKTGKKDSGIYYWKKMKAIVIPNKQIIFFEGDEPFRQVSSDGANSSMYEEYECFVGNADDKVYMRVYCPYISDKVQLCVPFYEFTPLRLETKEDVFNTLTLINRFHSKAQEHLNKVILEELKKTNV